MEERVKYNFYPTTLLKDSENELHGVRFSSETPDLYIDIVSKTEFDLIDIDPICNSCDSLSSIYVLNSFNKSLPTEMPSLTINYVQTLLKKEVIFDYSKNLYRASLSYNKFRNFIITVTRFFRNKKDYEEFCIQIEASNYLFSQKIKPALRIAEVCLLEYDFINKNTIIIGLSIFKDEQLYFLINKLQSYFNNIVKFSASFHEVISYIPTIDKIPELLKEEISAFACKKVPKLDFWNGIYDSPCDVFAYVGNNGKLIVGYFGENRQNVSKKCKDTSINCINYILKKTILGEIVCEKDLEHMINIPYFDIGKKQTITFKFHVDWNFAEVSHEKLISCFENAGELCHSIIDKEYEDVNPLPLFSGVKVFEDDGYLIFKFFFESNCSELFLEEENL